jgi:pimeloyl-ACP methyl ester carboxylesterase
MRRTTPVLLVACLAASFVGLSAGASPQPAAAAPAVVELPVTFTVNNTNTTGVRCTSDNKTYDVKGHIVAPPAALDSPRSATLYLHAVSWEERYWRLKSVPGYDYATQQAQNGHVSVTIDRLGYGASGKPDPKATCFGAEADVAHQIVQQLRSGKYGADGHAPVAFTKVFTAGSSVGAMAAHIESYTYKDVDGIINFGFGDFAVGPFAFREYNMARGRCFQGGDQATPGYTRFAPDRQDQFFYFSATKEVRDAVGKSTSDPCGQLESIPDGIGSDMQHLGEINVPVLLVFGDKDEAFPPPAAQQQMARYTGSPKVTLFQPKDTSHFPLVEATHLETVAAVDKWLKDQG